MSDRNIQCQLIHYLPRHAFFNTNDIIQREIRSNRQPMSQLSYTGVNR